jgi:hypothetical protein
VKKPLALLLAICLAPAVRPQTAQRPAGAASTVVVTLGQASVALTGPWKFHVGDDPLWASPDFDDSQWEAVNLTPGPAAPAILQIVPGWQARGHAGYWGYAWYRIHIQFTTRSGDRVAVAGPAQADDGYELFANGRLLGGTGDFRRGRLWQTTHTAALPQTFVLPQSDGKGTAAGSVVLAFRVWMRPQPDRADAGGLRSAPEFGVPAAVAQHTELIDLEFVRTDAWHIGEGLLMLLAAIIAAGLILFDRSDSVYRWLIAVFLMIAAANCYEPLSWLRLESDRTGYIMEHVFLDPAIMGAFAMVWWRWFRLHRPVWVPALIAALTGLCAISMGLREGLPFATGMHGALAVDVLASFVLRLLIFLVLILILAWGIRLQGREGWLTVPAILLFGAGMFQGDTRALHLPAVFFPYGVRFSLHQIADGALIAVLGILVLRRLLLSVRRQRELAIDVNQAREVQRVLIPEDLPDLPGWTIESEYRPALEVGGDFFQIIPLAPAGAVLIVIGDVTGKGLQAGMLVALSVGTIRTAADDNPDPVHVLQTLNRRLVGRAQATCLAMRLDPDGAVTLANAGHLPPCLNGKELVLEGAVPLGIVADAEFPVRRFQLDTGDRMTLMSDGIAEAQDEQGHLFGFERAQSLSREPARAIAEAAQSYGQQDDISVLCILRTAPVAAAVR